jgi:cytoskeleton protein RodZ
MAGHMLREARQAQGLEIDALASMIKVTPAKLEALESGRYEQLPDANFTRALAMTVCRSLKIDPAPVLAALPAAKAIPLSPHKPALNQPFKESRGANLSFDSGESFDLKTLLRPQWLAPILLLLASAVVYFMPESVQWPHWAASGVKPVVAAASAPVPEPVASAVVTEASAPDVAPSRAEAETSVAASSAASAMAEPVAPPAVASAATPVSTTSAPLVLMSHEPAWVEVRDGRGGILLSRHLHAGETVDLSGVPPLKLHLGNSSGLEVIYQGQPVELASYTRNNVARLELK